MEFLLFIVADGWTCKCLLIESHSFVRLFELFFKLKISNVVFGVPINLKSGHNATFLQNFIHNEIFIRFHGFLISGFIISG